MKGSVGTRLIGLFWNWPFLSALTMTLSIAAFETGRIEFALASVAAFAGLLSRLEPTKPQLFFILVPALPIVALPFIDRSTGYAALLAMAALLVWVGLLCGVWRRDRGAKPLVAAFLVAATGVVLFLIRPVSPPISPRPVAKPAPVTQVASDPTDAQSQFLLALRYRTGDGVDQDDAKALEFARHAADQGYPPAQTLAGMMYQNGEGIAPDPTTAATYYEKAAEQADPWAQSLLGGMYLSGTGVEQNNVLAYKWLTRASDQGNAAAKSLLDAAKDTFTDEEQQEGAAQAAQS